ncbi:MAG: peptide deformylase [Balneolaceae bacterium]
MSVLPIVTYDDEILHQPARKVRQNSEDLQRLIDDMFETMHQAEGVGLAAPQVGKLLRLFVADADPMIEEEESHKKRGPIVAINPELVFKADEEVEMDEGCLSIPGVSAPVKRPEKITMRYLDREFNEKELTIDGWWARVLQHEYDHLEGILFLDHLSLFKRKMLSSKLKEIAEGRKNAEYETVPKNVV